MDSRARAWRCTAHTEALIQLSAHESVGHMEVECNTEEQSASNLYHRELDSIDGTGKIG